MKEDQLAGELREADAAFGPAPALPEDLHDRVVRRWRRRRVGRRLSVAAGLVAAVATAGTWLSLTGPTKTTGLPPEGVHPTASGIRALDAAADARLATVERMLVLGERRRALGAAAPAQAIDPVEAVRRQVDRSAYLILLRADRLYQVTGRRDAAIATYQQVIKTFPQTRWAEVARQRESTLQQQTGDTL